MARRETLPPLNPARVFEVAGRLLSVSKAAEELNVTPAAVSRQVRTLEEFLGTPLFERVHGGLILTPAGARYLSELVPLFSGLRHATSAVLRSSQSGSALRIRSPATFAVRWLIPRLASFHQLHQTIDVQLTTSSEPLKFEDDDIDAGIELSDGDRSGMHTQRLIANQLLPVLAPSRPPPHLEGIANDTLLHSLARIDDWAVWLKAAGLPAVNAYRGMKYETSLLAYQAAIEGHGIAIAQRALIERELADRTLIALNAPTLDCGRHTYYFVWPRSRPVSDELAAFRDWLSTIVDNQP